MKINDREIASYGNDDAVMEGRLHHRKTGGNISQGFKERFFRLRANILFYFNVSDSGKILDAKPAGAFVLENCTTSYDGFGETPFSFSVMFHDEVDRKHVFAGRSDDYINHWVTALKAASYEFWRAQLLVLQIKLSSRTGQDPLLMYHRSEGSRLPLKTPAEHHEKQVASKKLPSFRSCAHPPSRQKKERRKPEASIMKDALLQFEGNHFGNVLEAIGRSDISPNGTATTDKITPSSSLSSKPSSRVTRPKSPLDNSQMASSTHAPLSALPQRPPSLPGTSVIARPRPVSSLAPPPKPPRVPKAIQPKSENLIEF